MSEKGLAHDTGNVEFLLPGDALSLDEDTCVSDAATREVSMRGDIEQMALADIFQTLSMSKMEGILRLRSSVLQRELYFKDGRVRCYVPARAELRRLGLQLMQAGLATRDQMQNIALACRRERCTIKQAVIDAAILPEQDCEQLFQHLAAEELYGLFTWRQGSFEFYKGPPADPVNADRLNELPEFDVNAILMEVARRSDEWELILDHIGSLDEVYIQASDGDDLRGDHREIFELVDGRTSVRRIAQALLIGLFEACRVVRDLVIQGYLHLAPPEYLLEEADSLLQAEHKRFAVVTIETLRDRGDELDSETLDRMALLLREAGEPRRAAATLLDAANRVEDFNIALQMLRDARALLPRSTEILEQLRITLASIDDPDFDGELIDTTDDLAQAYADDGEWEEAERCLLELDRLVPGQPRVIARRAIVLNRMGRRGEAVDLLLELAEQYKQEGQRELLVACYDQILKIDPRRRDIARARKGAVTHRAVRRIKMASAAAVMVGAATAGFMIYRSHERRQRIDDLRGQVETALAKDDVATANQIIEQVAGAVTDPEPVVEELRGAVSGHLARRAAEQRRDENARHLARLTEAAAAFDSGDLVAALAAYAAIVEVRPDKKGEVVEYVRTRFAGLVKTMNSDAMSMPGRVPPPPNIGQSRDDRRQTIVDMREAFPEAPRALAEASVRAADSPQAGELLAGGLAEELRRAAGAVLDHYRIADARRAAYEKLERDSLTAERLQPLFLAAREDLAAYRFPEALAAFRQLADEHPAEDELKQMFRTEVVRLRQLIRRMEDQRRATSTGRHDDALRALRDLRAEYPEIPFDRLLQLPLRIETSPPGARITDHRGQPLGVTPAVLARHPAESLELHLSLPGFELVERRIEGTGPGTLNLVLTMIPEWRHEVPGAVQHAPAAAGEDAYLVDRAGHIVATRLADGGERWVHTTGDASGLLPGVVVDEERVFSTSFDGTLRCLERAGGRVLWERPDLPSEGSPALGPRDSVWVATTSGRLVGLDGATGKVLIDSALPAACNTTPQVRGANLVLATTDGDVLAYRLPEGVQRWRVDLGQVILAEPVLLADRVILATAEAHVFCLRLTDGHSLWQQGGIPTLAVPPVVTADQRVMVACDDGIRSYRLQGGELVRKIDTDEPPICMAWTTTGLLWGGASGRLHRIGSDDNPSLGFQGPGRPGRIRVIDDDRFLVGFDGRVVHLYRGLAQ